LGVRVELRNVSKLFGEVAALRRVNAVFHEGERVALLGHNGAGKSTLLNLIATLTRPNSGEVAWYDDDAPATAKNQVRRLFSYLSHEPMLYPDLTALENLRFTARLLGAPADEAALLALLDQVGMSKARHRLFRNCSRGMQQRVSLARALLPQPRVLLLDEPFSGLDAEGTDKLRGALAEKSWIMTTHDLRVGYEMADRLWILKRGRVARAVAKADITLEACMALARGAGAEGAAA